MTGMKKPTVPDVRPLVESLYNRHQAGCCLHIVLDDGNLADDDVEFCLLDALELDHQDCAHLARLLLRMSRTQRRELGKRSQ